MLTGAHIMLYSKDADADRAFFRDVLEFRSVDAGGGWLIFQLPATEAAFHPSERNDVHELYFTCDDLEQTMALLRKKEVRFSPVKKEQWGDLTQLTLPGGGTIGLYQPKHPTAAGRS